MKILILKGNEILDLLPMEGCISLMSDALGSLARGEVYHPLRTIVRPPDSRGLLVTMPAYSSGERGAFGVKVICVFPDNPVIGKDAHQGGVLLFSRDTGELLALMNASAITALRTAAVSAVAARLLSREDAGQLTIIGAGVQARTHLNSFSSVRSIKKARVVCRNLAHAQKLKTEMERNLNFEIEPGVDVEKAVRAGDLIVTATNAHEPVIRREWVSDGAHITAIGTHSPATREIDGKTMSVARIFVDRRESAMNEAGEYILALKEGLITEQSILAEIGEVLNGTKSGRTSESEITLFKSLGLAIEDVACAEYLYGKAKNHGVGTWVEY